MKNSKQNDDFEDDENKHIKSIQNNSHHYYPILIVIICIILEYLSGLQLPKQNLSYNYSILPNKEKFNLNNARNNLKELTSFGARMTGSKMNEIIIPKYLISKLSQIKVSLPKHVKLDIFTQHPSSTFYLDFLGGMTNVYQNLTNVIAKLYWDNIDIDTTNQFSILINAHYDSVAGSPGAADDGIGVACMLEIIRAISQGKPMTHPIVFLFNGAEESNHQAAHGFITQHSLAKDIKYVLNLEAIGSGGRELVFQCNSGWLVKFYGKVVPHPHVSVTAHELFKYLLYRMASTDWSTLLKYGSPGIRGLDTAYTENGYVYHTTFDKESIVPNGTLVNTGENILYLAKALASSIEVPNPNKPDTNDEHAVFFDFLGYFVIVYSGMYVTITHSIGAIIGLCMIYMIIRSSIHSFTIAKLINIVKIEIYCQLFPVIIGALYGALVMIFCPMRWYDGGIAIALLLYAPPIVLSIFYSRSKYCSSNTNNHLLSIDNNNNNNNKINSDLTIFNTPVLRILAGLIYPWMLLLIPCIIFKIMGGYVCFLWICNIAIALLIYIIVKYFIIHHSRPPMLYICSAEFYYTIVLIPMILIWTNIARLSILMMIPLFGKSGTVAPMDIILGAIIAVFLSAPIPVIFPHNIPHWKLNKHIYHIAIIIIIVILITCSLFLLPYSNHRPKRLWVQHIKRLIAIPSSPQSSLTSTTSITPLISLVTNTLTADTTTNTLTTAIPMNSKGTNEIIFEKKTTVYREDCGLWISSFDFQGMNSLKHLNIPLLDIDKHRNNAKCIVENGDCYLQFPWYFPVSEVLKDSVYIPTACYVLPTLISASNTQISSNNAIHSNTKEHELKVTLSSLKLLKNEDYYNQYWYNKWHLNSNSNYRLVRIVLQGPSRMDIVIRDHQAGNRIHYWSISDNNPLNERHSTHTNEELSLMDMDIYISEDNRIISTASSSSIPNKDSITITSSSSSSSSNSIFPQKEHIIFTKPPLIRAEGVHYLQVGFGICDSMSNNNDCIQVMHLLVEDDDLIDIAAYGHYIDVAPSHEIETFIQQLPDWSKGAEWTKFPSYLIKDTI